MKKRVNKNKTAKKIGKKRKNKEKKRNKKKTSILSTIFLIILILIALLFLIRIVTPTEIDDVTPGIPCPEIEIYNPDILYVIPNFENNPISENKEWCDYILSLNKELRMHGITHTYKEFLYNEISQEELNYEISEFENCFGFASDSFKSPQLATSSQNRKLIKENNLEFRTIFNQITHKVYHCSDSTFPYNKAINLF
jgi:predicted deacetylase